MKKQRRLGVACGAGVFCLRPGGLAYNQGMSRNNKNSNSSTPPFAGVSIAAEAEEVLARLNRLKDTLHRAVKPGNEPPARVSGLLPDGTLLPFPQGDSGDNIYDSLMCRTAPDGWDALVLVFEAVSTTSQDDGVEDHIVAYGMTRDGEDYGCFTTGELEMATTPIGKQPEGRLPDTCRRFWRLPTPPPGQGTELLYLTKWLSAIWNALDGLDAGLGKAEKQALSWGDAMGAILAETPALKSRWDDSTASSAQPGEVISELRRTEMYEWEDFRAAVAERDDRGIEDLLTVSSQQAQWMDEGMFFRCISPSLREGATSTLKTMTKDPKIGPGCATRLMALVREMS